MDDKTQLVQPEQIEQAVLLIRGQRVMLDRDLAALYGVTTSNLNKAVMAPPEKPRHEIGFHAIPKDAAGSGKTKAKRK